MNAARDARSDASPAAVAGDNPAAGPGAAAAQAQAILARLAALGVRCTRIENDSRRVRPGDVFLAWPGARHDARQYIADAARRGAAAILWEVRGFRFPAALALPNIGVEHLQACAGHLAHAVYGRPSERLRLIGITGTNGKTTCSHWLADALAASGQPCAVIGTLGNGLPGQLAGSANTTPDALALHAHLAEWQAAGVVACAMEVSSIGLDQQRVAGAHFDTAVLTNLSRDHLDYHGDMDAYAQAKARLFDWPALRVAVLNLDDAFGLRLAHETSAALRIGYTINGARSAAVDDCVEAREVRAAADGTRFELCFRGSHLAVAVPVIGRHNVLNLLAVSAALLAADYSLERVAALLPMLRPPPGRLQTLGGAGRPLVVIDYAHTPDALANVLESLRPVAVARGGRLCVVFGCGGNRDRGKRPLMGAVAARLADRIWLTSDNPRDEEPLAILAELSAGLAGSGRSATVEVDRERAVAGAIAAADVHDVVLLAGKGHEAYQEIAGVRLPYSDEVAAQRALAREQAK